MNRRIPAFIAITLTVLATLVFAAPASATTRVSHGTTFSGVAAGSDPVMAISANGERVVAVSTPRAANGCPDGTAAFVLKGGFANSDGTTWEDHNEWLEAWPGDPCSVATAPQVMLSDDGTSGLIVWTSLDVNSQTNMLRFARIDWSTGSFPTVTQNDLHTFDAGPWGWPNLEPKISVALSLDGSRAVAAWAKNVVIDPQTNSAVSTVNYTVIDMNNPSAATIQVMPGGSYPGISFAPDVAISADGAVVMMSRPGSPNQTPTTEFRIARVFTCSHNCYPSRLKVFQATVPAGSGGSNLEARMNLAGDRIAVAWAKPGDVRKASIAVFNPYATVSSSTMTNITSKISTVSQVGVGGDLVLAMNESGTKLAYLGQGADKTTIVTASIKPSLVVSSVSTAEMYPETTRNIQKLYFLNATAGAQGILPTPERLAVISADATSHPDAQTPTIAKVLVSDSSSKPTNWSEVFSTSAPGSSWFTSFGYASSRSSNRFVAFSGRVTLEQFAYSYEANAVVSAAQNVLTVTTKPAIAGTGAYNRAMTLGLGKWTSGATISYLWKRDGAALDPQPSGLTYTPLADDDMGARMSATITASKTGYYDTVITPAASPTMNGKPIRLVLTWGGGSGPNGAPVVGDMVWVSRAGTFPATGQTVLSYSWKVGNSVVGQFGSYIVTRANVGKKISLTMKVAVPNWGTVTQTTLSQTVLSAQN